MSNVKYPEKNFLLNYDLSFDFFSKLGLNVIDVTPLRKVFVLKTEEGKKILKYIDYDEQKLNFLITCINLLSNKYENIVKLMKFDNGKSYVVWKDKKYIVMDLIDGRETTFTNIIELKMCTKEIAKMHIASKEILSDIEDALGKNINDLRSLSLKERFRISLNNMEFIRYSVSRFKYKNEFDNLFLANASNFIDDIKKAKDLLNSEKYDKYEEDIKNISICHNDLASHNFLINDDKLAIIDFEYASIDLSIMDLADILLKGIKNVVFDFDKCINIIDAYNSVNKLSDIEYKLLYIILLYPRDIYSIVKDYYFKEKDWEYEVFLDRFTEKVQNEEFRKNFLEKFYQKYL